LSPRYKNNYPLLLLLKKTLKKNEEKKNYTVANVQKTKKDDGIPHHVAKPPLLNLNVWFIPFLEKSIEDALPPYESTTILSYARSTCMYSAMQDYSSWSVSTY